MEYKCVDSQYFLARIKQFEDKYRMKSWNFQVLYENEKFRKELPEYSGRAAVDYSEWAFLCENLVYIDESPPCVINSEDQQRPEQNSGLCFSESKCDQRRTSVSGACRAYAAGYEGRACRSECGRPKQIHQ